MQVRLVQDALEMQRCLNVDEEDSENKNLKTFSSQWSVVSCTPKRPITFPYVLTTMTNRDEQNRSQLTIDN